jgi:hypothetical protein
MLITVGENAGETGSQALCMQGTGCFETSELPVDSTCFYGSKRDEYSLMARLFSPQVAATLPYFSYSNINVALRANSSGVSWFARCIICIRFAVLGFLLLAASISTHACV